MALKADVGKEADIKHAVDVAVKEFGRLDIMVWKYLLQIPTLRLINILDPPFSLITLASLIGTCFSCRLC
jgi:NAD(P)-dependent dehydrogenase (short-subunit alcohol dehydrogenase family)